MKQHASAWGNTQILKIVSALVLNDRGALLLLKRHPAKLGGSKWATPGGRVDPGETEVLAMRRELLEETGLKADTVERLGVHRIRMPHGTVHMTTYMLALHGEVPITLAPAEHKAYGWYPLDSLPSMPSIIWGLPTVLRDFGLLSEVGIDHTLDDGSKVILLPE